MRAMSKHKSAAPGGKGKGPAPRTAVQMPTVWLNLARAYASKNRQPTLWYLIGLIEKDARERGEENLPPVPWEEDRGGMEEA